MVSSDKHNPLSLKYVMDLYKTVPIVLIKYTLPDNGKPIKEASLSAFCLVHMMGDSIHIDIIMTVPGQAMYL